MRLEHSLIRLTQPDGRSVITRNTTLADFCFAAARCCALRDQNYALRYCYVEYENVASPSTPVVVPSVTATNPDHARPYYDGLALSASKDYLRVPLTAAPTLAAAPSFAAYFSQRPGDGNIALLQAQTAGTAGVYGRAFSDTANSRVYGIAIAAAPVPQDPTRDIVVLRAYYAAGQQQLKLASGQIAISVETPFGLS